MNRLKVVVIVSSDPSDIYFANQLARRLNVVGIIVESPAEQPDVRRKIGKLAGVALSPWRIPGLLRERAIVRDHVRRTSAIDRAGFGNDAYELTPPPSCKVARVYGKNAANSPEAVELIRGFEPDLLALCGCSILKDPVLSIPRLGSLNLHGGLAQRYRGVWTTLWAVVNEEPEYVGATVHFVNPGIDDGDIVYQSRPEVAADDDPESLYVKVVKLGVCMMISAVEDIEACRVQRYPLEQKGRLYLSRMVTPDVLHKAWSLTESGVIPRYLADRAARDAGVLETMRGVYRSPGV